MSNESVGMDLPPELEILQTARSIGFGRHGFFQALSQETVAYQKALVEKKFSSEQLELPPIRWTV